MSILIKNVRIIDPVAGKDQAGELMIENGQFVEPRSDAIEIIDGSRYWAMPGLIDLSARIGLSSSNRIQQETAAAAAGGITTLITPPDDAGILDHPAQVRDALERVHTHGNHLTVLPLGAVTQNMAGEALADMHSLVNAGCVGLSNANDPIRDTQVLHCAMQYINSLGRTLFLKPQDPWLAAGGCAHAGRVATRLGLKGIPAAAETVALARDLALIENTKTRIHFGRISCAASVDLLERGRQHHLPVSADVAIHNLFLMDTDLVGFDPRYHTDPPLRTQSDRDGLRSAIQSGLIDAICSDHNPLTLDAKTAPFPATEAGVSGLDTLLGLSLRLVEEDVLTPLTLAERLHTGPAKVLGINATELSPGNPANLILIDPDSSWTVRATEFKSRGKLSPFEGWQLYGQVQLTISNGTVCYRKDH